MKTARDILHQEAIKYNPEGFKEMLYWEDARVIDCVYYAMESYADQFIPTWTSIHVGIPNNSNPVLAIDENSYRQTASYKASINRWMSDINGEYLDNVIGWMPLPECPKHPLT